MVLKRTLNSIGKRCFINCFENAWRNNGTLTNSDIMRCDPTVGKEESGLNVRRNSIQKIFSNNQQFEALQICFNARIGATEKKKAKMLHDLHCKH